MSGSLHCIENSTSRFICEWKLRNGYSGDVSSPKFHPVFHFPSYLSYTLTRNDRFTVFLHLCEKALETVNEKATSLSRKSAISLEAKVLDKHRQLIILKTISSDSIDNYPLKLLSEKQTLSHPISESCVNYGFILRIKILKGTEGLVSPQHNSSSTVSPPPNTIDLVQDFKKLYLDDVTFSDVTISIEGKALRAHKLILSARSAVFRSMMEHDYLESIQSNIIVTDCDYETFDKFLMYLYTGEMEDESLGTAMSLYALAVKYDVQGLRIICFEIIRSTFDSNQVDFIIDSVCAILLFSHRHSDQTLKGLAIHFIVNNFSEVGSKEKWKEIMIEERELSSEVLVHVAAACRNEPKSNQVGCQRQPY